MTTVAPYRTQAPDTRRVTDVERSTENENNFPARASSDPKPTDQILEPLAATVRELWALPMWKPAGGKDPPRSPTDILEGWIGAGMNAEMMELAMQHRWRGKLIAMRDNGEPPPYSLAFFDADMRAWPSVCPQTELDKRQQADVLRWFDEAESRGEADPKAYVLAKVAEVYGEAVG